MDGELGVVCTLFKLCRWMLTVRHWRGRNANSNYTVSVGGFEVYGRILGRNNTQFVIEIMMALEPGPSFFGPRTRQQLAFRRVCNM
jgi:hypothetical protein